MGDSQKDRILQALRLEPRCGTDFLRWGIARYSARIHELRGMGYEIVTRTCKLHRHDSPQVVFELVDADQGRLPLAEWDPVTGGFR